MLLIGFKNPKLKPLTGKRLSEVARMRGVSPEDAAIDLVIEDDSRVETVYFLMSEDNVRKQIKLPYMSFGSDAEAAAPEGIFLEQSTHPRAYGNFARLLGRYVRDEKLITLPEAIRRLTSLPASNLGLKRSRQARGGLFRGYRRVRSGDHPGSRDLREAAAVLDRRIARRRQWRSRSGEW